VNGPSGNGDLGQCRRRREARAATASHVGIERELADDEQRSAGLGDGEIGPPISVLEVAEADELLGHAVDHILVVIGSDADEYDGPAPDLAQQLRAGADRGPGHALYDEPHRSF
jgi:hypothetical protein